MKKPVHIIGGGLTGLSLAVGLQRRGVPAVVHEASTYPRHRVCGEFILGVEDATLRDLGINLALADVIIHEDCIWQVGNHRAIRRRLPLPARAISRHRLDARLAELGRTLGVEVHTGDRAEPRDDAGWISTTGRPRTEGRWLGLKAHFLSLPLEAGLEMHLGCGGYAGLTQVEDGRVNVCALLPAHGSTTADRADLLPARLEEIGLTQLASRLRAAEIDAGSITGVTHFALGWQKRAAPAGLSLGDSASIIPPFTGAGMSMAFESAALACPALEAWSSGQVTWPQTVNQVRTDLQIAFSRRLRWAQAIHPLLLSTWSQALLSWTLQHRLVPFDLLVRALRR